MDWCLMLLPAMPDAMELCKAMQVTLGGGCVQLGAFTWIGVYCYYLQCLDHKRHEVLRSNAELTMGGGYVQLGAFTWMGA